jgi:O-acetyl-ADP-ribose deacetylase (regulator of RNase III)
VTGKTEPRGWDVGAGRVEIVLGDVTREDTDAIANAANSGLLGGGGVDGAIHRAAGPELLEACRAIKRSLPGGLLPTGGAVITPGFALRARYVIHCVGPVYAEEGRERAATLLARCHAEALRLVRAHALASVAFPAISTGIYGYPVEEAARVALGAVAAELRAGASPLLVRFVLFGEPALEAFTRAAGDLERS